MFRAAAVAASLAASCGVLAAAAPTGTLARFTGSATAGGNSFTTVSCVARTPFFATGFEFGALTAVPVFDSYGLAGGGAIAVDAAVKRSGAYSVQLTKPSGGVVTLTRSAAGTVVVERFALHLDSLPSANVAALGSVGVAAGSTAALGYNAGTKKLQMAFGSGVAAVGSVTLAAGTWYRIDLKVDVSANPRTAQWQINGVAQTPASAAVAASTVTGATWGSAVAADVFGLHLDDLVASRFASDYPFGAGHAVVLLPSASPLAGHNGSGNFRQENAAIDATAWTHIDDVPLNTTADYVQQITNSPASYLQFTLSDPSEWCFNGVQALVAYHSANGSSNDGKASIFDGTTETVVASGDLSTSTALAYASAMVTPAAKPWSATAVKGLLARVGYSNDTNPAPSWDGILLEADAQN